MMKQLQPLCLTVALLFSPLAWALEARWLGIAGLTLSDGATTVLFDPAFTKPTLSHWALNAPLIPDEQKVKSKLQQCGMQKAQAIFVSHTHFDHASDVGVVAKITDATVYGGQSLKRIATFQYPAVKFAPVKDREAVQIGSFRVTSFKRPHAPIIHWMNFHFLQGEVPENFSGKFYEFYEGDTWGFVVEHPEGVILIDQGSHVQEFYQPYAGKLKAFFMGVANKKSVDKIVEENIGGTKSPLIIPMHFDIFFWDSEELSKMEMPGVELIKIQAAAKEKFPEVVFKIPNVCDSIKI